MNVVSWAHAPFKAPWRFQFHFNEIVSLVSSLDVVFQHVSRLANGFADTLSKQGVERSQDLMAVTM